MEDWSMRTNYIVSYDVSDPKRLRRVHRACRDYGVHLQYSVFECDLTERERLELEHRLVELIDRSEDQVLFIELGPSHTRGERRIIALGLEYAKVEAPCFVL
jgi:CRISPR-associated protein Cas2